VAAGDRAFDGSREDSTPPPPADIDYRRVVLALELYHQLSPQVGAGALVPYFEQDADNDSTGSESHDSGIGDMAVYALWSPWAKENSPKELWSAANVSFSVGISFPTGEELAGELPGLHNYHLGSGSLEFKFGARYVGWAADAWPLFGAVTAVIDEGANRIGFRYGNSYDFALGTAVSVSERISVWVLGDAVVREEDMIGPIDLADSGGTWWYLELGAAVVPASGLALDWAVDWLVYRNVNGTQPVVDVVGSVGVRHSF
jgi:hypothetical protein